MATHFIYGLCWPGTTEPLYVGRSKSAKDRIRGHTSLGWADYTPKGIWVKYLLHVGQRPAQVILEQASFSDEDAAGLWGQQREQHWIKKLFGEGVYLFNHGCWWKEPERAKVPPGVREAWARLHEVYFRLGASIPGEDPAITQFIALRGIRALVGEYPCLELAPVAWLDPEDDHPEERFGRLGLPWPFWVTFLLFLLVCAYAGYVDGLRF